MNFHVRKYFNSFCRKNDVLRQRDGSTCACICPLCVHARIHAYTHIQRTMFCDKEMAPPMRAFVHVCMIYVCVHACKEKLCVYLCIMNMRAYTLIHIYTLKYIHTHLYIYIYIYIYIQHAPQDHNYTCVTTYMYIHAYTSVEHTTPAHNYIYL